MKHLFYILISTSLVFFVSCKKNEKKSKDPVKKSAPTKKKISKKSIVKKPLPKKNTVKPVVAKKVVKKTGFEIPKTAKVVEKPIPHKIFTLNKKEYTVLDSLQFKETKKIRGYNKKVPLQVFVIFEKDGTIFKVLTGSHKETPDFIKNINKNWTSKFDNLKPSKPILGAKGKAIDAMTDATMSTEAIKKTADFLRKLYIKNFVKNAEKNKFKKK